MITLICGPMYSGKSTALFQRLERLLYARKKVLLIRPKKDDRGYFSHNGGVDPEKLAKTHKNLVIEYLEKITTEDYHRILKEKYDAIFIDEYFMIPDSSLFASLYGIDVYYGGLLASSECKLFDETIKILPRCDKIKKLNGVCMDCGSELGNYSFADFDKTSDIVVGDTKYKCLCSKCYQANIYSRLSILKIEYEDIFYDDGNTEGFNEAYLADLRKEALSRKRPIRIVIEASKYFTSEMINAATHVVRRLKDCNIEEIKIPTLSTVERLKLEKKLEKYGNIKVICSVSS